MELKKRHFILIGALLWTSLASAGDGSAGVCVGKKSTTLAKVTNYFTPHVKDEKDRRCKSEGTCRFDKTGKDGKSEVYVKTVGEAAAKESETPCKFGKGTRDICLSACDSVAADLNYHNIGDIIYFPDLVGVKCSNGTVNMTGRAIVVDKGTKVKGRNRFDFFFGECKEADRKSGECNDAAAADMKSRLSQNISYCLAGTVKMQRNRSPRDTMPGMGTQTVSSNR